MCIMCWYQHALMDSILKVLNGFNVLEMVGPSMGARNCCDKQLLMSVDDRDNCNPCFGKLSSVPEENVCQIKVSVKHQRR